MKTKSVLPKIKRRVLSFLKAYHVFLLFSASVALVFMFYSIVNEAVVPFLSYLFASLFFIVSSLVYNDFRKELKRTRFSMCWRFIYKYSLSPSGYAVLHIIIGASFMVAELIKGYYLPLALLLSAKGMFEYITKKLITELASVSLLYYETVSGEIYTLTLKDPF